MAPQPSAASAARITVLTPDSAGFAAGCAHVGALFARREAEFAFNPEIQRSAPDHKALAADPGAFVGGAPVVVLTTWADRLRKPLLAAGFSEEPVPWPAGPDNSAIFRRPGAGRLRYFEIVNEADPRIAPAHLTLMERRGGVEGGAITAITGDAAWLAVMAVAPDAPRGSGTRLWQALARDLARRGVRRIDLGTQTAESFYLRMGLNTTSRAVRNLRLRRSAAAGPVWSDLVMMTGILSPDAAPSAA